MAVFWTWALGLHQPHSHPEKSNQEENRGGGRLYIEFLVVVGFFCVQSQEISKLLSLILLRVCKRITLQ